MARDRELGPYRLGPDGAPEKGIYVGDCRDLLASVPAGSIDCGVTSPPYWGLRDYGAPHSVWGGESDCSHDWREIVKPASSGGKRHSRLEGGRATQYGSATHRTHSSTLCERCGAWRGALGLEPEPELYVEHLTQIMRLVRRALRPEGTLWLNLGDTYRDKRLMGVPWRTALALQEDGWWLRADIIWEKQNVMPASVRDRPTRSHEYLFLLAKSARYHYDREAILEPFASPAPDGHVRRSRNGAPRRGRNRRTVWSIPTQPYPGAHFAVFPPSLVEPCVLAGCPEDGVVLDPFVGAGTTGLVCAALGRRYLGFELNGDYAALARQRIAAAETG